MFRNNRYRFKNTCINKQKKCGEILRIPACDATEYVQEADKNSNSNNTISDIIKFSNNVREGSNVARYYIAYMRAVFNFVGFLIDFSDLAKEKSSCNWKKIFPFSDILIAGEEEKALVLFKKKYRKNKSNKKVSK